MMWKFLVLTACLPPPDKSLSRPTTLQRGGALSQAGAEKALACFLDCGGRRCKSLAA
jgi:hypothetical protein